MRWCKTNWKRGTLWRVAPLSWSRFPGGVRWAPSLGWWSPDLHYTPQSPLGPGPVCLSGWWPPHHGVELSVDSRQPAAPRLSWRHRLGGDSGNRPSKLPTWVHRSTCSTPLVVEFSGLICLPDLLRVPSLVDRSFASYALCTKLTV